LFDDRKCAQQTICQEHLDCHACEGDAFFFHIVTGDVFCVYHYEPESKRQSMQLKHLLSLANKKFKTQASAGKVMLTVFWDVNGPILVHFQEKSQSVTSARYSDMPVNELKLAIRLKCLGLLSKRVLLLHDNACPHTAAHTVDTLHALKFEVLKHPPYSPDLVPSDFHVLGPMKEHLLGQKFANDNEVMEAVQS
jgi:histone-lysine N-methyltransferase SETMAR